MTEDIWGDGKPIQIEKPKQRKRHPDFIKQFDFGKYRMSIAIWIHSNSATLVVSSFENGKWYIKLKEELSAWR